MYRPSRSRRILKWTGVGLCLLSLVAGIVSAFTASWCFRDPWGISLHAGLIQVAKANFKPSMLPPPTNGQGVKWTSAHWESRLPSFRRTSLGDLRGVIPIWLPLLLTAIPTAWLWYRDRRRILPGHCTRCGYNLTGNTSGVCSECGEATAVAAVRS